MSDAQQYLTSEKMQEFVKELTILKTEKRKQVAENLEYAKKLGDLSENAEYHEARQEQAEVEDRINHIENLIKTAMIVDEKHGDVVSIGSTVKVQKDGEKDIKEYKIVGSEEADMAHGKVSNLSPLGSALLGKKKGEKVSFTTPKGKAVYTLISI
ncbi:MAG: transcription elongation factor GreA [Patescibacteria group bacterium]|nr:transcription elongation factor GreA [Patescibacteria group bacterium]